MTETERFEKLARQAEARVVARKAKLMMALSELCSAEAELALACDRLDRAKDRAK